VGNPRALEINEELVEGINRKIETAELKRIAIRHSNEDAAPGQHAKVERRHHDVRGALATVPPDL